ncbi:hypothetical protein SSCG_06054 [Streptomyces clavuligerus]|nr:hypothetical protein SSCG_06054 [Streptomyces clavuligerus]
MLFPTCFMKANVTCGHVLQISSVMQMKALDGLFCCILYMLYLREFHGEVTVITLIDGIKQT